MEDKEVSTKNIDWFYNSDEFQAFFKHSSRSAVVKANAPYFTIVAVSENYLAITHRKREDLLGKNFFDIFPGNVVVSAQQNSLLQSFERVIENKVIDTLPVYEYQIFLPDISEYITEYWWNSNEPILDGEGHVTYIIRTVINVTEKVLAERSLAETDKLKDYLQREQLLNEELATANEELKAVNEELFSSQEKLNFLNTELEERVLARTKELQNSENHLRNIFEQAPLAFCVLQGADLIIELANDRMLRLWNETDNVIGKPHHQVRYTPETAGFLKILDEVYATGIPFQMQEVKAYTAKGNQKEWGYFSFAYQPIKDETGHTTGILALVDDVTETVETRIETQRVASQLHTAASAARLGSWHIHPQTKDLIYNKELARIFGYEGKEPMTYDEAIGQVSEEYREKILDEIEKAIADGGDYDITYSQRRFNDNNIIWLRSLGKITQDEQGDYSVFAGVVMDITEQVTATQSIQKLNEELAALNEEQVAINEELIQTQNDLLATNKQVSESEERFRNMAEGTGVYIAVGDETSNATYFNKPWTELTGRSMNDLLQFGWADLIHEEDRERYVNIYLDAFKELKPFTGELRIRKRDGDYTWLLANCYPRFLSDGSFVGYISSCIDINERKKDDQRKNDFIGMVSHEIKTPLTSLSGYLQILEMRANTEDSFAIGMLDKANKQISRITTLINGFLNVSRLESGKMHIDKQRFNIADLVKEAEDEVVSTINSHRVVFAPVETTFVYADRDKIGQVVNNLISNAVKYSSANTVINVACVTDANCVTLSVTDEGIGIKEEDKGKLFDRYYRVNEGINVASGFGIGLYLCSEIIQRHDGKIWVESEVGKGSTFSFSLPVL